MRAMPLILLVTALSALAQVAAFRPASSPPQPQPPWMDVFKNVYGPQAQGAALGSLDREVEKSWAAALAAGPRHPSFEAAAQQTSQYFASQGYDLKAEKILRQAISAAGPAAAEPADRAKARSSSLALSLALAQRLTQDQKFLAAVGVIQELLEGAKNASDPATPAVRISALMQLAQLREQMGEFEAAEALLQEAKTLQSAPAPQSSPAAGQARGAIAYTGSTGFVRMGFPGGVGDLAGFYQRQGDTAKAEALFKKDLDDAKAPEEMFRALQIYAHFLQSQQRSDESVAQWEKLIALQSASSRPEDRQMLAGSRINLAQILAATGKTEKALEILRVQVADGHQRGEALRFYANILIQQKQFEEAEKVVEQIRQPTGKNAAEMAPHAEAMADSLLADIRQMQNRVDEARALREKTMSRAPKPEGADAPIPTWTLIQPVQELMARHKYDEAMAQFQRLLADSTPRIHRHPEEIGAFTNLVQSLPQGRQDERLQLMRSILSTLDGVRPADHPRVARGLNQFVGSAMHAGFNAAEITRLLERQERILVASKGEDSLALNEVSRQRAGFFAFRGDYAEAAVEMKRALKRTEAASGAKSQPALQMMRELVNSLQATNESWPEEESLRLAVIERSGQYPGLGGSLVHDMNSLASRYFTVGQREKAVAWMDRAIELARKNPQTAPMVQQFEQQRAQFANEQVQQPAGGNPFYGAGTGQWFNRDGFSSSRGGLLGKRPMPAVIRSPIGVPTPPPPPPPPPK